MRGYHKWALAHSSSCLAFPISLFWAYLLKVIPETRRAHVIWYLRFHYTYIFPLFILISQNKNNKKKRNCFCLPFITNVLLYLQTRLQITSLFVNFIINQRTCITTYNTNIDNMGTKISYGRSVVSSRFSCFLHQ